LQLVSTFLKLNLTDALTPVNPFQPTEQQIKDKLSRNEKKKQYARDGCFVLTAKKKERRERSRESAQGS
jgi:hypothetical protein